LNMGRLLLEVAAQLMFPGVLSFDFLFHESVEKCEHESEIFLCLELSSSMGRAGLSEGRTDAGSLEPVSGR